MLETKWNNLKNRAEGLSLKASEQTAKMKAEKNAFPQQKLFFQAQGGSRK